MIYLTLLISECGSGFERELCLASALQLNFESTFAYNLVHRKIIQRFSTCHNLDTDEGQCIGVKNPYLHSLSAVRFGSRCAPPPESWLLWRKAWGRSPLNKAAITLGLDMLVTINGPHSAFSCQSLVLSPISSDKLTIHRCKTSFVARTAMQATDRSRNAVLSSLPN